MTHPMTPELAEEIGTLAECGEQREKVFLGGSKVPQPAPVLEEMERRGLLRRQEQEAPFTPSGNAVFRTVVRRHRLAEVLLSQVLQVSASSAADTACWRPGRKPWYGPLRAPWARMRGAATQAMRRHRRGAGTKKTGPCRRNPAGRWGLRTIPAWRFVGRSARHRLLGAPGTRLARPVGGRHQGFRPGLQFEHILSEDVTDSICTFLSHPPTCPHGKAIPRGDCCTSFRREISPLVRPVLDLSLGGQGCIVFIQHAGTHRLDRLATLGILPGTTVRLVQRRPSVVLQADETTVALAREVAAGIYVRPLGSPARIITPWAGDGEA